MGFWALGPTMGALGASLVATHTLPHLAPWQDQFIISGCVCMGVVVVSFIFLRELSPQLRDQLMVTERERALVEARAKGIDVEAAIAHPFRTMLKIDLIALIGRYLGVPALLFRVSERADPLLGGDLRSVDPARQRDQRLVCRRALRGAGLLRRALGPGPGPKTLHDRSAPRRRSS